MKQLIGKQWHPVDIYDIYTNTPTQYKNEKDHF